MTDDPLHILLVDDDASVREAVRRALSRTPGWHVAEAEDGPGGLAHLRQHRVDVLLCDYQMPIMSGLEVLELVRVTHPHVVRLLLTGHADLRLALHALNGGAAHRYLVKPWHEVDLRQVVRESLAAYGEAPGRP
ncbi:MAG TPA: response regulator [Kofleriaceae bacterium]|nr:response regulator [Kofleriaceae bacterium]